MNKVLVIQTAFIGDAILSTALIEKIHQEQPKAKIDYLVRKSNAALLNGHPFLNRILVWDKQGRKYADLWRLLKWVRLERYDLVLNVQRYAASGILTAFSGAKKTVGYKENPLSFMFSKSIKHRFGKRYEKVHEIDRVLDLWKENTIRVLPKLYPTDEDVDSIRQYQTKPYITIAPASVWFTKQLPKEKWVELISRVPNDLQVYLTGGKSDVNLCMEIDSGCNRHVEILAGKLSLLQTAALMQSAVMNYANDSAPVHLASAVNAPITEVFCSTVPDFGFTPLSDVSHVVQIEEKLTCRPCGMHGKSSCPKGHFKCATTINAKEIPIPLGQ